MPNTEASSHHLTLVYNSKTLTQFPLHQYSLHSLTLGRQRKLLPVQCSQFRHCTHPHARPSLPHLVQTQYSVHSQFQSSTGLRRLTDPLQLFIIRNNQTFETVRQAVLPLVKKLLCSQSHAVYIPVLPSCRKSPANIWPKSFSAL